MRMSASLNIFPSGVFADRRTANLQLAWLDAADDAGEAYLAWRDADRADESASRSLSIALPSIARRPLRWPSSVSAAPSRSDSHLLNDKGQWAYYGRVGGCIITGNEDGAKHCAMNILYSLQHLRVVLIRAAASLGFARRWPVLAELSGSRVRWT